MKPVTIILIEDDDLDAEAACRVLLESGVSNSVIRCETGTAGIAAIESVGAENCLVLLDSRLGADDGIDVLKRIQKKPSTAKASVVMLTGFGSAEAMVDSVRHRALGYIEKPLDFLSLVAILRKSDRFGFGLERRGA